MKIDKMEIDFSDFGKETEVEIVSHDDGITLYVYIDGNTSFEIDLSKKDTRLHVKEYDGKTYFNKSLRKLWYNEDE